MKFQSLIAAIMHSMACRTSLAFGLAVFPLSGCMGLLATKHTYDPAANTPSVKINGAQVRMQLKPEGTANGSFAFSAMVVGAAVATLDGPFRWRIEAVSPTGGHENLIVHRLRTRTSVTHRDEWYPADHLGQRAAFTRLVGGSGAYRAVYDIPGLLKVKPREDGALEILADITVTNNHRAERRTVRFRLDPAQRRQDEFVFLPAEIVKSFGQTPEEWQDHGWE